MYLCDFEIGKYAKIKKVNGEGSVRHHLLDMGVIPGAKLKFERTAPMGDPIEITIHGYELSLRLSEAQNIEIEEINENEYTNQHLNDKRNVSDIAHPGIGEGGKFHTKCNENKVDKNRILTFALVGNQNTGKTTLFNKLTGSNQHVGNFPGVTVDKKSGSIIGHKNTMITDLPGIYSMSPYSAEEIVSRDFILDEKPNCIINIIDATNIERNLCLTTQLLEMDIPVVVALNMMDEVSSNGGNIDVNKLETLLGTPVVPISAMKNQGVTELIEHAVHIAKYDEKPLKIDYCDKTANGGAVHRGIHAVVHLIEDHIKNADLPIRFTATKVVEGDDLIINKLNLTQNEKEMLEHIIIQMEEERGLDRLASIADMRFNFINTVCASCVKKPKVNKEQMRSKAIDKILCGKYTALPFFIGIMFLIFYLTFNVIGPVLQDGLNSMFTSLSDIVDKFFISKNVNIAIRGLVIDGIFNGVGSIISFLPIIIVLFFFLSILEDSGYLARVAFFMDKLLRKIGLSGRSIVPLLIGFGCSVPAIMATRTLPSERDRKMTILLTPFMSCTAKLPIYAFLINAFFTRNKGLIMTAIYFVGILFAILISFIYRKTISKGEAVPFVMELPTYRMPTSINVAKLLWEKAKDFILKASSIILVATVIIWCLQSFDIHFNMVSDSSKSIIANVSGIIAPIFAPIGLDDWRICTSLFSGFIAKESVVSTMIVLFENAGGIETVIGTASAVSLLVFSLLYTPCVASISAIKKELSIKWAIFVVVWQCIIAWVASFIVYNIIK